MLARITSELRSQDQLGRSTAPKKRVDTRLPHRRTTDTRQEKYPPRCRPAAAADFVLVWFLFSGLPRHYLAPFFCHGICPCYSRKVLG